MARDLYAEVSAPARDLYGEVTDAEAATAKAFSPQTVQPVTGPTAAEQLKTPGGYATSHPDPAPEPEDTWADLASKFVTRQIPLFTQQIAGGLQAIAETGARDLASNPAYLAAGGKSPEQMDASIASERAAGVVPGQKLYEEAQRDIEANQYQFGGSTAKRYLPQIAEGVAQMLPTIATALVTRSPGIAASLMAGGVGAQQYGESRGKDGRTVSQSMGDAMFMGAAESLGESIPLGMMMKPGGKFLASTLKTAGAEAVQEALTQVLQTGYSAGILNEKMTWGEAVRQVVDAGIVGGGMGAGMHVIAHPFAGEHVDTPASEQVIEGQATSRILPRGLPAPSGVVETAVNEAAVVTSADEASPIPTDAITAGRVEVARAAASGKVDTALTANGLPKTGARVQIDMGNGRTATGTMADVFEHNDPDLGAAHGIRVALDDGTTFEEFLSSMQRGGMSLSELQVPTPEEAVAGLQRAASAIPDAPALVAPAPTTALPTPTTDGAAPRSSVARAAAKIIGVESGGNANARNTMPGQTASGLGQFTDATWLSLYKKRVGADGKSDAQILALKNDPTLGRQMTEYAVDEADQSLKHAGLPVNDTNRYLQHFLGPTANKLIAADPYAPVESLLPASWIAANPSVLRGKTANQVVAWAANKMRGGAAEVATPVPYQVASADAAPSAAPTEETSAPATAEETQSPVAEQVAAPEPVTPAPLAKPAAASTATVSPLTDKSVIVRGLDNSELSKQTIRVGMPPKAEPLWNAREQGWVVAARHADKVRAAVGAAAPAATTPVVEQPMSAPERAAPPEVSKQDALKAKMADKARANDGWPVEQDIRDLARDDGRFAVRGGATLTTPSGRITSPAPKFNDATRTTRSRSLGEQEKWLREEAIAEAETSPAARNALPFLRSMRPGNMSQSDHGTVNDVLFGDYQGPKDAAPWTTDRPPEAKPRPTPAPVTQQDLTNLRADPSKPIRIERTTPYEYDDTRVGPERSVNRIAIDAMNGKTPMAEAIAALRNIVASGDVAPGYVNVQMNRMGVSEADGRSVTSAAPADAEQTAAARRAARQPIPDPSTATIIDPAKGTVTTVPAGNQPAPLVKGQRVTFSKKVGYLSADTAYEVDHVEKSGRVNFRNVETGGSSTLAPYEYRPAQKDGTLRVVDTPVAPAQNAIRTSETAGPSEAGSTERPAAEPAVGATTNPPEQSGNAAGAREDGAAAGPITPRPQPAEAPSAKPAYGSDNKLVSRDRAAVIREKLRAKMNQMNSGVDPEALALFTELGIFHLEAGVRRFADFAHAVSADLGMTLQQVRPFLRSAYNGARDMMEDHGLGVAGMDSPDQVRIEMAAMFRPGGEGAIVSPEEQGRGLQDPVSGGNARASAEDVQRPAQDGRAEQAGAGEVGRGARDAVPSDRGNGQAAERPAAEPARPAGSRGTGAVDADRVPAGEPANGRGRGAGAAAAAVDRVVSTNWRIEPGALDEARGAAAKARDNVRAIEIVKALDESGRPATREEQAALAKYVGWGGLKNAFPKEDGSFATGFDKVGPRVRALLGDEEYAQARRSIQYAHYTSEKVVRPMWDAARRLGFEGGKVFEPGMGTGNFLGMMPADLAAVSQYHGLEYDRTTARIAQLLYPQSGIQHADYTRIPAAKDAYDLVIGNPPFSGTVIKSDPEYGKLGFVLHDFFFAKALDSVRPGGLLMFVTSAGTMNKVGDDARQYLSDRADLVGAVRLPGNAFEENAGTSVTTDIVVLRKRLPGEQAGDRSWTGTTNKVLPNREGATQEAAVSAYFAAHPEMVLGVEGMFDKLVAGDRYAVRARPGSDITKDLPAALDSLPANVMTPWEGDAGAADFDLQSEERKSGSFYIKDGILHQQRDNAGVPVQSRGKGVEGGIPAKDQERIRALVPIRDALREVYAHDLAGNTAKAEAARATLNRWYDAFVQAHGPINKAEISYRRPTVVEQEVARAEAREEMRLAGAEFDEGSFDPSSLIADKASTTQVAQARRAAREAATALGREFDEGSFDPAEIPDIVIDKRPNIDPFIKAGDQEGYRLRAIEHYDDSTGEAKKGRVFFGSVVSREVEPEIKSAGDALLYVLNKTGRPDLDQIAARAKMSREQVLDQIGSAVFRVPEAGDTWQTREQYLSGNVRQKLVIARAMAERDASFQRNVDALEAAQPADLAPTEIAANLGMPWIPPETIAEFGKQALGLADLRVRYTAGIAQWSVEGDRYSAAATTTWGTSDRSAPLLISDALNRTAPKIYRKVMGPDGRPKQELDLAATQAAQDKVRDIRAKFSDWIWSDSTRADKLAAIYNRDYNNLVAPEYDGGYLTTPGIASDWSWRPHQTRVVARIIQSGNTYMAHAVGAGKTSAMIGAGMEMRRLGLVRKPMYAVPNHMLSQFTKEFYEQYPTARIQVADERQFHTDRRKQFVANVANEDLDAVIITHSAFGKIPISDEFGDGLIEQQVDAYREMLGEIKASGGNDTRITQRRIEQQIEAMEQRLSGKKGGRKDQVFTFEEMGVDFLFVDEAHLFRKLDFATKMGDVKGVDPNGSQASYDLFAKSRYLETRSPSRSLVLASGTPITNTMAELFSLSRYLQPQALAERGIGQFDAWAGAYGEASTELEPSPGGGYKSQTRFSRFVNVAELSAMVRQVMDVVTSQQLSQYVTRPEIKGGGRKLVMVEMSEEQRDYKRMLAARERAISLRKGPPQKGDDIMLSVIGDGRKSAIDMRLVNPEQRSAEPSKLEALIDNVARIANETKRQPFYRAGPEGYADKPADHGPATQMVFSDLGINGDFPIHKYIAAELASRGIPRDQIAIISDFKSHVARQRLFNDMNDGKVRVLIGSVAKMGTGVNAQRRLYAVHNLDPQWYPANDEQRNGRALRQGNMNREIEINDYATKGTYDENMWGMMGRKAGFIEGFMRGDPSMRTMEDLGEASAYEQAKAMVADDPRILQLATLKQDLQLAERRRDSFEREQYAIRRRVNDAEDRVERLTARVPQIEADIAQRQDISGDAFKASVGGQEFADRGEFGEAVLKRLDELTGMGASTKDAKVGEIGGFTLTADITRYDGRMNASLYLNRNGEGRQATISAGTAAGITTSVASAMRKFEGDLESTKQGIVNSQKEITEFTPQLDRKFEGQAEINQLSSRSRALEAELEADSKAAEAAAANAPKESRAAPQRPEIGSADEETVRAALQAQLEQAGIADRTILIAAGKLFSNPRTAGQYHFGVIRIALDTSPNPTATMNHEIIHALRDMGLFRSEEWRALERNASLDTKLMDRIRKDYPGLGPSEQIEEAVAEAYAAWRSGEQQPTGFIRDALRRVSLFFKQLRAALTGNADARAAAERVMGDVASGDVGRRTPSDVNPRARVTTTKEARIGAPGIVGNQEDDGDRSAGEMVDGFWNQPDRSRFQAGFDYWRTGLQDRMLPLLRIQTQVESALGRPLEESENPYLGEEISSGRVGAQVERLADDMVAPLFEQLRADGITVDELESYLYARHAPERNARIASINGRFEEGGGSGMTDEEAASIIDAVENDPRVDRIKQAAARVDGILRLGVRVSVEGELLSRDDARAMRGTWKHYVPLRGRGEADLDSGSDRPFVGSGINVKGAESRRAFGRASKASNIIAYSIMQAEGAILRSETNRVARQFYEMAKAAPDPNFWTIDKIESRPVWDKTTGQVEYQRQSRISAEDADYTISVKIDGEEHRVTLNRNNPTAKRVATAMRNLTAQQTAAWVKYVGASTRFFSKINTSLNPEFLITNALRDVQAAAVNLLQHNVPGLIKNTGKGYVGALTASREGNGDWAKWRREFEASGGKVYFSERGDLRSIRDRIAKEMATGTKAGIIRGLDMFFAKIADVNDHVENAVRLSAYRAAREAGVSEAKAASMARNVTVNFTRKGQWGPMINSLYAFFNAGVQGSATLILAAQRSNKVRVALGSAILLGFVVDALNRAAGDDDDDGEPYWDKVPAYDKEKNLILMIPGAKGYQMKVPLGLGLNAFVSLGRNLSEIAHGRSATQAMWESATTAMDAFNPLGGGSTFLSFAVPTFGDPFLDLTVNRNFAGKKIQPEASPFDTPPPPSENFFPNVSGTSKMVARGINAATGGDRVVPGAVSISPEVMDYIAAYYTGGVGRFVLNTGSLIAAPLDPDKHLGIADIPFARRLVGAKSDWQDKGLYYDRTHAVTAAEDYAKRYVKAGDREGLTGFLADNTAKLVLRGAAKSSQKAMSEIRKDRVAIDQAQSKGALTADAARADKERLDQAEQAVVERFNQVWNRTLTAYGKRAY